MQTTFTPRIEETPEGVFLPLVQIVGPYQARLVIDAFKAPGSADTREGAMQLARLHAECMTMAHQRSSSKMAGPKR